MTDPLPCPSPQRTMETNQFWDATAQQMLILRLCTACGRHGWYPRARCASCGSAAACWVEASGMGNVYSYTIVNRGEGRYRDVGPYVLAYVELDEGPRVMTNVVDAEPLDVHIGQRVRAVFHDTGEGSALVRFVPA